MDLRSHTFNGMEAAMTSSSIPIKDSLGPRPGSVVVGCCCCAMLAHILLTVITISAYA